MFFGKKDNKDSKKKKPKKSSAKKKTNKKKNAKKDLKSDKELAAARQGRSLIMFVSGVLLAAIICIPGDMIWLWAHNAVRGVFSFLSLFWAALLIFLAVVTMIDKEIPKLWFRTSFTVGFAAAFNACVYIFSYKDRFDIKETFELGTQYKDGGVLGFILGFPFVKLFGRIPARILIIIVMLVLLIFVFDISVKEWYSIIFNKVSEAVGKTVEQMKAKKEQKNPVQIGDDAYFDSDDDFEEFDINEGELDSDSVENKADDFDFNDIQVKENGELPQSPTFADEDYDIEDVDDFFENISFDEDELKDDFSNDDDGYSIDIDIDSPMEDTGRRKKSANKNNPPKTENEVSLVKAEENIPDDLSDDEIFDELFDEEFMDTMDSEHTAVTKVAEDISRSKNNPKKSEPEQKQYDPQTMPVEQNLGTALRSKKSYQYPPTELLNEGRKNSTNHETELKENAKKLIETLESFSVRAKIVGYSRGPSITRYEIQPAPGVKISKITNLSDDIALNLAADGVRMEAPIPGKPAIGIEIPNKNITSVSIRELLESDEFNKNKKTKKLECVLGKDVAGKIIITDLAKMPHLLIAGTTGSGKSVCVNSILMSILFRASPDDVKMILIDPKLVEFSKYKGIPHLLIPVVSDAKKAAGALNWAVNEMEERYKEFSLYNVKDIDSYNKMVDKNLATMTEEELEEEGNGEVINGEFIPPKAKKKMPKIVIAIDELADLMMVAPGEVEESICRLAQKARAAGMHLVIATQRPSVNVITGVIKANIPSRISLKVASYVDSKTILDTGGGEKLIGRGDMLYSPVGAPKPVRVQGGYSSDDDIEAVTDFIKGHSTSDYDEEVTEQIEQISETLGTKGGKDKDTPDNNDIDDSDPMLEEAIKLVVEAGQASTSLLQRRLRLGYARAGRLIDTMEQMGIVGPHEGSKSRKVLMSQQQWMERQVTGSVE